MDGEVGVALGDTKVGGCQEENDGPELGGFVGGEAVDGVERGVDGVLLESLE